MQNETPQYVVCVRNEDYTASLELRKIYAVIPDADAQTHGMVRLVDESGEDYLYPRDFFMPIEIPERMSEAFALAS